MLKPAAVLPQEQDCDDISRLLQSSIDQQDLSSVERILQRDCSTALDALLSVDLPSSAPPDFVDRLWVVTSAGQLRCDNNQEVRLRRKFASLYQSQSRESEAAKVLSDYAPRNVDKATDADIEILLDATDRREKQPPCAELYFSLGEVPRAEAQLCRLLQWKAEIGAVTKERLQCCNATLTSMKGNHLEAARRFLQLANSAKTISGATELSERAAVAAILAPASEKRDELISTLLRDQAVETQVLRPALTALLGGRLLARQELGAVEGEQQVIALAKSCCGIAVALAQRCCTHIINSASTTAGAERGLLKWLDGTKGASTSGVFAVSKMFNSAYISSIAQLLEVEPREAESCVAEMIQKRYVNGTIVDDMVRFNTIQQDIDYSSAAGSRLTPTFEAIETLVGSTPRGPAT